MAPRHGACLAVLRGLLGPRLTTAPAHLQHHAHGEGHLPPSPPDAVAWVETTTEVSAVLRLCSEHRCPVVPFGAGTSLEGHVNAAEGGLSLDLSRMTRILEVNDADLDCLVEAGVTREALNHSLRHTGLFFPVDPGANATLGGMASTRASGTTTVRYGAMRENVLGLTAVLADGEVIRTGGRARKSAAGYDLTRLLIGAEGTLAVLTELRLRLHGIPAATAAARCPFRTLEGAIQTVVAAIQMGVPVARIELLDEASIEAVNGYSGTVYPACPTLFLEFQGPSERSVEEAAALVEGLARDNDALSFEWTGDEQERKAMWHARHTAYWATLRLGQGPGVRNWPTDVCVPISRLAECLLGAHADIVASGLRAPIVGHVGDGNFHAMILYNETDPLQVQSAVELNDRIIARAVAAGGTCTGEHGIGSGKAGHLVAEHGAPAVAAMRRIKTALDPLNLLNPGKIFLPPPDH
jgi:D-lactate dehydrogenase (cytochrome)